MDTRLWVNVYAPPWRIAAQGVKLEMATDFPEGETARLTLTMQSPKALTRAAPASWSGTNHRQGQWRAVAQPAPDTGRGGRGVRGGQGFGRGRGGQRLASFAAGEFLRRIGADLENGRHRGVDDAQVAAPSQRPTTRIGCHPGPLVLAGDLGEGGRRGGGGGGRTANGARPQTSGAPRRKPARGRVVKPVPGRPAISAPTAWGAWPQSPGR
jgi:hypothetical protein